MSDDGLVRSITALHTYVAGDESLGDALCHVVTITAAAVRAERAGMTLVGANGRFTTAVYTDDVVPEIDRFQYEADRGPCLSAFRSRSVQRVATTDADQRWPEHVSAARERGIHSTLSLPLVVGGTSVGALNLYGSASHRFDDRAERLATVLAEQASVAVGNAMAYWGKASLAANLASAMEARAAIEQAKGVIMVSAGCSPDDAFELLRMQSQAENRKLRDIAVEIVDRQHRVGPRG